MVQVSPGVVVRELDFSQYVPSLSSTIAGVVGGATKGELNKAVLITSGNELIRKFGQPILNDFGIQSALQYLRNGNQLWYVRVGDSNVASAIGEVTDGNAPIVGQQSQLVNQGITIKAKYDGSAGDLITVEFVNSGLANTPLSVVVGVMSIVVNLATNAGVKASLSSMGVNLTALLSGVAGNSIQVEYIESGNNTPLSVVITPNKVTVNLETDGSGDAISTNTEVADEINASVAVVGVNAFLETVTTTGNTVPGAYALTNLSGGVNPAVTSTANTVIPVINASSAVVGGSAFLDTVTGSGALALSVLAETNLAGGIDAFDPTVFEVEAPSPGSWGNFTSFVLSVNATDNTLYDLVISSAVDGSGKISAVEKYQGMSLNSSHPRFIENINVGIPGSIVPSEYIRITVIDDALTPVVGVYNLTGGNDGLANLLDADYIGTINGQGATGLQVLANPEAQDINLVAIPGVSSSAVVTALLVLAEEQRSDCLAVVDAPFGMSVQEVIDWHNGVGYSHQAFNSSYGALYWSWVKVYDAVNKAEIFLPPSGFVMSQMAYTDYLASPWTAPAGLIRGQILPGLQIEMSPDLGQREQLYGGGNSINAIVNFTREGIHIWGQRTLQRQSSALDRVNVRRLMLFLEKTIASTVRYLNFDDNNETLWSKFEAMVKPVLDQVKTNRGIVDYRVLANETTTSTLDIDRNNMNGKIMIKPTKTGEVINIDFVLLSTGAQFNEFG